MLPDVHIIIVTHNSSDVLPECLAHIDRQHVPAASVIIVDSGSTSLEYLQGLRINSRLQVLFEDNIGFAQANNKGFAQLDPDDESIILFLNPDTFLPDNFLGHALEVLLDHPRVAIVSGKLLAYDSQKMQPNGRIDSTGIYRKWYGRWYDRGQGEVDTGQYDDNALVPALCGALLCCRYSALASLPGSVFDGDFFLYKEDIELGIRVRKAGWHLLYAPRLFAYHCRGWKQVRGKIPFELRRTAAVSELLLYRKHFSPYIVWALIKYIAVRLCKI